VAAGVTADVTLGVDISLTEMKVIAAVDVFQLSGPTW